MGDGLLFPPPSFPPEGAEPDDVPGPFALGGRAVGGGLGADRLFGLAFPGCPFPSPFLLDIPNMGCLPSSAGTTTG